MDATLTYVLGCVVVLQVLQTIQTVTLGRRVRRVERSIMPPPLEQTRSSRKTS